MKIKKVKLEWYAFRYNWNKQKLEFINILQGMEEEIAKKIIKGEKDKYKPVIDYISFKEYIKSELMYRYWSKREHECLIGDLKEEVEETLEKHDIWWQLEPNLDRICEYINNQMELNLKERS